MIEQQRENALPLARTHFLRRVATVVTMAAALAFALQGMLVAASEAATGDSSHYYVVFAFEHADGQHHTRAITHMHADGTIHTHAIDDSPGALGKHIKQPGSNLALVICIAPHLSVPAPSPVAGEKLTPENPCPPRIVDLGGMRRPPKPPSIA
jgi:hypothetical protein